MDEIDIRALALFFFFALLDDRKAIECSVQAMTICHERKKRNPELKNSIAVVYATAKIWERVHLKIQRGLPNSSMESGWLVPANIDLGPWREFQKNATNDELLTVIWSKILNYSDQDISEALGLTVGTVRYRLARSFRKLGGMILQISKAPAKEKQDV